MSGRGDAARRRRWGDKDHNDAKQLEAMVDAWLGVLPADLCIRLEEGLMAIFGERYGAYALNSTREERARVLDLIEQINLTLAAGHDQGDHQPGHEESSMSLEQALAANTAALEANTAALLKAAGSTGGGTTKASGSKKEETASKPKHSREELAALMGKVKADKSKEVAQALIKDHSPETGKLADVPDDKIDALYAAGEAKLKEEGGEDL